VLLSCERNLSCSAVYRRYIILFLNSVNRDQEDALKQMKFTRNGVSASLFDPVDVSVGLITLAQIKLDTTSKCVCDAGASFQSDLMLFCSFAHCMLHFILNALKQCHTNAPCIN